MARFLNGRVLVCTTRAKHINRPPSRHQACTQRASVCPTRDPVYPTRVWGWLSTFSVHLALLSGAGDGQVFERHVLDAQHLRYVQVFNTPAPVLDTLAEALETRFPCEIHLLQCWTRVMKGHTHLFGSRCIEHRKRCIQNRSWWPGS